MEQEMERSLMAFVLDCLAKSARQPTKHPHNQIISDILYHRHGRLKPRYIGQMSHVQIISICTGKVTGSKIIIKYLLPHTWPIGVWKYWTRKSRKNKRWAMILRIDISRTIRMATVCGRLRGNLSNDRRRNHWILWYHPITSRCRYRPYLMGNITRRK